MAGNGEQPPASRPRFSGDLTINCLDHDLLCRVFIRFPSFAALVRAVLSCNEWRRVVASDPDFRRRFSAIHSPLLGLFFDPPADLGPAVPSFAPVRRDDPELATVIRSGDFFLTPLHVSPKVPPSWTVADARGGLLLLTSLRTGEYLLAVLNPLERERRVLGYFNLNEANILEDVRGEEPQVLQARLICADEDPSRFRIFCLAHDERRLRVLVFSHDDTNGLLLPWIEAPGRSGPRLDWLEDGMQVGEFIYWFYRNHRYVVVMDTRELRYHVEAIHPSLNLNDYQSHLLLGEHSTNANGLLLGEHTTNANGLALSLQIVYADGNRVCRKLGGSHGSLAGTWTAGRVSDLGAELANMPRDVPLGHELVPVALRDGFLYFTTSRVYQHANIPCWYASFNMETGEVERLFLRTNDAGFKPYHMPWPRALSGDYGVFAGQEESTSA
ncbi:hypothetical protein ACP70R_037804 [Stipagrostis hirtigluma subsp. patula]